MSVRLRNFPPVPDINTAGICTSKCFCSWGSLLTANWLSQTTYPMFAGLRTFIFQHCVILEIHWQKIWLRQFLCHWFTSELTMSTQLFTDKQILKDCNLPKTQSPCLKGSIAIVNWWTFTWTTLVARSVIELFYVSHHHVQNTGQPNYLCTLFKYYTPHRTLWSANRHLEQL